MTMASETKSLFFQIPLLLLTVFSCSRNRVVAASNECLGELTIVNYTQASRPAAHSLTVERSSVVTIACWTRCGYVDWFTITPTGRNVPGLGGTQFNCTRNGTCLNFTGNPDCTNVQPGQGNRFKHELSLLAKETFYIDCRPQCPFGNNKLEGRTNGLLVHVIDPPEPTQVTPTRSTADTSSKTSSVMCLQDQPSQTMPASSSTSTLPLASTVSPSPISSFTAQTTSLRPSMTDFSTTRASRLSTTKLPEEPSDNIVDRVRATQTAEAVRTETISFLTVIVVSTVLFIIMLVAFFILLIFYINAKRRIVELKLHSDEQRAPTKDTELSSQL